MRKLWNALVKTVHFFVYKVLRLKLSTEAFEKLLQFIKFGLVGVSNSVISYGTYLILLHFGMHYTPANIIGFTVSVFNSYYWNNRYVFKAEEGTERGVVKTFLKTYISYAGTGIVLSNILLVLWVEVLNIPEAIGPILNLCVTIPVNFLVNKYWAYRDKKKEKE